MLTRWRDRARTLRRETLTLYLAARDPRVHWFPKAIALITLAYALSPIDLIPDFIPVLGHLDDLIIVPAGLLLARRLIPDHIIEQHRHTAANSDIAPTRLALAIVITTWLLAALLVTAIALRLT
jgi:uncharacterized membrane protein YkvA (DUF1232 family)